MKRRYILGIVELILGFAFLMLGIFTFVNPGSAMSTVVYVYGFAAIMGGAAGIVFYAAARHRAGFGPVSCLISGIFNILLGILLVSNVWVGRFALSFLFSFWLIFLCGLRLCSLGFIRLFAGNGEYWLTLVINVLGLLLGFFLLVNPVSSLLTMAVMIACYLVFGGVEMIVFAFGHFKHRDYFSE